MPGVRRPWKEESRHEADWKDDEHDSPNTSGDPGTADPPAASARISTKWLDFTVYVRLPLIAVLLPFQALEDVRTPLQGEQLAIAIAVIGPIAAALIILAVGLDKRRLWAWRSVLVLILLEGVLYPLQKGVPEPLVYLVVLGVITLIWFWPNYVYFRKRRFLFS